MDRERIEIEDEQSQEDKVFAELAPMAIGQITLVGGRLLAMKTVEGRHIMTFDNGITAEITGQFKLRKSETADLGGEAKKELTGESVHEHFKQLEAGEGEEG